MTVAETRTSSSSAYTTRCSNCGAPLEVTPDAVGYVCEYCGWTGIVDGVEKKGYEIITPLSREANRNAALGLLKKNLGGSFSESLVREEKFYAIPFWVASVAARSSINGYRSKTKSETYTVMVPNPRGGMMAETRTRLYTVYVPVREELNDTFVFVLTVRKNASFYGLDEIRGKVRIGESRALDPLPLLKERMEFLDVEFDDREEAEWAETAAEDEHYRMARERTTELFECETEAKPLGGRLVYYPVYQVDFEVGGKVYRATFDGATGGVVKAEFPVPGSVKAAYVAGAYGLIALGSLVALSRAHPATAAVGTVLAAVSGLLVYRATRTERVKKG